MMTAMMSAMHSTNVIFTISTLLLEHSFKVGVPCDYCVQSSPKLDFGFFLLLQELKKCKCFFIRLFSEKCSRDHNLNLLGSEYLKKTSG